MSIIPNIIREYNTFGIRILDYRYPKSVVQRGYEPGDPAIAYSALGNPILDRVTLMGGRYTDMRTNREVKFESVIIDAVLVTVNIASKVIRTEIQGRDGTVKEYIGQDDAQITINGIVTAKNGSYPRDIVSKINNWINAPVSKGIVSNYLQNIGITDVVVMDASFGQEQGSYSQEKFTINCVSDAPVELKISNSAV